MKSITKACPCVLRQHPTGWQILAFAHPIPEAGKQIVKGTLEEDEAIESALLRELEEESGLTDVRIHKFIGTLEHLVKGGSNEECPLEKQIWQIYDLRLLNDTPKTWVHSATGSPEEEGLLFSFFWQNFDGNYKGYHPVFIEAIELVESYLKTNS